VTIFVIANPVSGTGGSVEAARRLASTLRGHGAQVELCLTQYPEHAIELARRAAASVDTVVAVGGDGTVNEVATGILQAGSTACRLGVFPLGTGNDVALHLQIRSLEAATAALLEARARRIDVVEVRCGQGSWESPRFALLFAAIGFATDLILHTTPAIKRRFGQRLSYSIGFLKALLAHRAPLAHVRLDQEERDGRFLHLCAGNTEWGGGGVMRLSPGARWDDGWLDLCLIPERSRLGILQAFPKLLRGTFPSEPGVVYRRGRSLEVRCEPPALVQCDGTAMGSTPATFRIRPAALSIAGP